MSYYEVFSYMLATNATNDPILEANMDIMIFNSPSYQDAVEYEPALWT